MTTRKLMLLLVCLVSFLELTACAVNPVSGKQQFMLLSEDDEAKLGLETDKAVVREYGIYEDRRLQDYLQGMGGAMGRISHRPNLDWTFKVMDSPVLNAFAAPGGNVYITRGLLAAINNEAELVSILGHEIGHITARHSAQKYSNMILTNLGLGLGEQFLGGYSDVLGPLLEKGAGLLFLKFSRDDEREADALGVEYASRFGYDATRMADFFTTLASQPREDRDSAARLPEFFSTHPNPVNRRSSVFTLAREWQDKMPGQEFDVNRDDYLAMVNGLAYGVDPRKGFQEGQWYYFPKFEVKLPVPAGWSLEREGHNLQIKHPDNKALSLFSIREDSQISQVVRAFLTNTGARQHADQGIVNNDIPGRLILSSISTGRDRTVIISYFYQKGQDVFAFHGVTRETHYDSLKEVLRYPASGFATITEPDKLNRQPQRITIHSVDKATSLTSFLQSKNIDKELWETIAWLNGKRLPEVLPPGTKLKVIR